MCFDDRGQMDNTQADVVNGMQNKTFLGSRSLLHLVLYLQGDLYN